MNRLVFAWAVILTTLSLNVLQISQAKSVQVKEKSYSTSDYKKTHSKGLFKTPEAKHRMKAFPRVSYMTQSVPVPSSVDLSSKASPPEDQGQCGCCWDFSLTKALRSEYMLKSKDPGQLQFNYLLNNCGPGPSMNGCDGGDFSAAQSFEFGSGPGLNALDPFKGILGRCKKLTTQATAVTYSLLGEGSASPTFKDLAYAIGVGRHVLSIDVAAASGEWESYSGGIYNDCNGGSQDVDHMINLVGYDCETSVNQGKCVFDSTGKPINGDGFIKVMNNWGNNWGEKGYMRMRMYDKDGSHCNAIATDALFFEISLNPTPETEVTCSGFLCDSLNCKLPWCS